MEYLISFDEMILEIDRLMNLSLLFFSFIFRALLLSPCFFRERSFACVIFNSFQREMVEKLSCAFCMQLDNTQPSSFRTNAIQIIWLLEIIWLERFESFSGSPAGKKNKKRVPNDRTKICMRIFFRFDFCYSLSVE